ALFSPISQVNYAFYQPGEAPQAALEGNNSVQCVVGQGGVPFGKAQEPAINDFADGVDTMAFLAYL
nr:acyl-CoA reductase [Flavihumibacter sp.]